MGEIDVLVTDVVMPGMTGQQLAQSAVERNPDLRVVYMSGHTEDVLVRDGARARNLAFVQKPFTRATLLRAVEDALAAAPGGGPRSRPSGSRPTRRPAPSGAGAIAVRRTPLGARSRRSEDAMCRGGLCSGLLPAVPNPPGAAAHRLGAGAPNTGASSLRPGAMPCSRAPLTAASSALRRCSASASGVAGAPVAVVGEHAVREGEPPRLVERPRARSSSMRSPSSTWPSSRPSSVRPISAPSVNSRVLPRSWTIAAVSSRFWSRRGCSVQVSSASVATATVCSSRPPR